MRSLSITFFMLLALWCAGCTSENTDRRATAPSSYNTLEANSPAVDFLFNDMNGRPFRLSEEKGRGVLLFFWRMACADCKESMKSLEAANLKYRNRGLEVVAVGADTMHSSPITDVKEFLTKNGYTFRVLRDSDGFVAEAYQVIKAPTAFFIDRKGVVVAIKTGKMDFSSEELSTIIEGMLKEEK